MSKNTRQDIFGYYYREQNSLPFPKYQTESIQCWGRFYHFELHLLLLSFLTYHVPDTLTKQKQHNTFLHYHWQKIPKACGTSATFSLKIVLSFGWICCCFSWSGLVCTIIGYLPSLFRSLKIVEDKRDNVSKAIKNNPIDSVIVFVLHNFGY